MLVRILHPVSALYKVGVAPGNITEIPSAEKAMRMIASGHAEAVEGKTKVRAAEKAIPKTKKTTRKRAK